jgi:hypothetical protein
LTLTRRSDGKVPILAGTGHGVGTAVGVGVAVGAVVGVEVGGDVGPVDALADGGAALGDPAAASLGLTVAAPPLQAPAVSATIVARTTMVAWRRTMIMRSSQDEGSCGRRRR